MRNSPSLTGMNPPMRLRVVVLPQPDGPRRQKNSPAAIARETRSRAMVSPYRFVTSMSSTMGRWESAVACSAPVRPPGAAVSVPPRLTVQSTVHPSARIGFAATSLRRHLASNSGRAATGATDRQLHRHPDVHRLGRGILQGSQEERGGEIA